MTFFEPTKSAALERLALVNPAAYARTRNAIDGAVTRLSPYLTHGLLSLREVYDAVNERHPLPREHKLVFELGWRAYYRHVWHHRGDSIHQSLHAGPLPEEAYQRDLPADVVEARTGIPAIDRAVQTLYATGYLHNHARMWLASYLIHWRKVHWYSGAQWMLGYLLDGDIASNHLSWQWVAGTGSHKPYVFNADNVAKYAPEPWHSFGSAIDTDYETLNAMAHTPLRNSPSPADCDANRGVAQPPRAFSPPEAVWSPPNSSGVHGRHVWLLHPWSIGSLPESQRDDTLTVGVGLSECHADVSWSEQRWRFATDGLRSRTPHLWWGDAQQLANALHGAKTVSWQSDPHIDVAMQTVANRLHAAASPPQMAGVPDKPLFEPVTPLCASFAQWWRQTRIDVRQMRLNY
jgi:deoxyribodipyrimidine photo-lyase